MLRYFQTTYIHASNKYAYIKLRAFNSNRISSVECRLEFIGIQQRATEKQLKKDNKRPNMMTQKSRFDLMGDSRASISQPGICIRLSS